MSWELHPADCLGPEGMGRLPDGAVDCAITDPPYGERTHSGQRHGRRGEGYKDSWVSSVGLAYEHLTPEDVDRIAAELVRITRKWILVMTSHDLFPRWEEALCRYSFAPVPIVIPGMNVRLAGDGPSSWTIWLMCDRPVGLVDGTRPGAYVGSPGRGPERAANPVKGHKPLWLMEQLVRDYSDPNDLICDPFAGSGTTGVAAVHLGRRFVGWERDPKYAEVARQRLASTRQQYNLFEAVSP